MWGRELWDSKVDQGLNQATSPWVKADLLCTVCNTPLESDFIGMGISHTYQVSFIIHTHTHF